VHPLGSGRRQEDPGFQLSGDQGGHRPRRQGRAEGFRSCGETQPSEASVRSLVRVPVVPWARRSVRTAPPCPARKRGGQGAGGRGGEERAFPPPAGNSQLFKPPSGL